MSKRLSLFLLVSIVLLAAFAQPLTAHAQWGDDRSDIDPEAAVDCYTDSTGSFVCSKPVKKRVVLSPEEKVEADRKFWKGVSWFVAGYLALGVLIHLLSKLPIFSGQPSDRTRHYEPRSRDYM